MAVGGYYVMKSSRHRKTRVTSLPQVESEINSHMKFERYRTWVTQVGYHWEGSMQQEKQAEV